MSCSMLKKMFLDNKRLCIRQDPRLYVQIKEPFKYKVYKGVTKKKIDEKQVYRLMDKWGFLGSKEKYYFPGEENEGLNNFLWPIRGIHLFLNNQLEKYKKNPNDPLKQGFIIPRISNGKIESWFYNKEKYPIGSSFEDIISTTNRFIKNSKTYNSVLKNLYGFSIGKEGKFHFFDPEKVKIKLLIPKFDANFFQKIKFNDLFLGKYHSLYERLFYRIFRRLTTGINQKGVYDILNIDADELFNGIICAFGEYLSELMFGDKQMRIVDGYVLMDVLPHFQSQELGNFVDVILVNRYWDFNLEDYFYDGGVFIESKPRSQQKLRDIDGIGSMVSTIFSSATAILMTCNRAPDCKKLLRGGFLTVTDGYISKEVRKPEKGKYVMEKLLQPFIEVIMKTGKFREKNENAYYGKNKEQKMLSFQEGIGLWKLRKHIYVQFQFLEIQWKKYQISFRLKLKIGDGSFEENNIKFLDKLKGYEGFIENSIIIDAFQDERMTIPFKIIELPIRNSQIRGIAGLVKDHLVNLQNKIALTRRPLSFEIYQRLYKGLHFYQHYKQYDEIIKDSSSPRDPSGFFGFNGTFWILTTLIDLYENNPKSAMITKKILNDLVGANVEDDKIQDFMEGVFHTLLKNDVGILDRVSIFPQFDLAGWKGSGGEGGASDAFILKGKIPEDIRVIKEDIKNYIQKNRKLFGEGICEDITGKNLYLQLQKYVNTIWSAELVELIVQSFKKTIEKLKEIYPQLNENLKKSNSLFRQSCDLIEEQVNKKVMIDEQQIKKLFCGEPSRNPGWFKVWKTIFDEMGVSYGRAFYDKGSTWKNWQLKIFGRKGVRQGLADTITLLSRNTTSLFVFYSSFVPSIPLDVILKKIILMNDFSVNLMKLIKDRWYFIINWQFDEKDLKKRRKWFGFVNYSSNPLVNGISIVKSNLFNQELSNLENLIEVLDSNQARVKEWEKTEE
ncbi:MAG: hypothetical protein ACFFCS_03820, partial [Candidatus Hodarchaeota archaeon]